MQLKKVYACTLHMYHSPWKIIGNSEGVVEGGGGGGGGVSLSLFLALNEALAVLMSTGNPF